jgi:hypothetical protein
LGEGKVKSLQDDEELNNKKDELEEGRTDTNNLTGIHLLGRLSLHTNTPKPN